VSIDNCAKHQKFIEKESLNFDLLADIDKKMVSEFGVWVEKSMGVQRDSFLVNPEGFMIKHYSKVKPENHADEVLADLKNFQNN
jgi:peroxiredoxin Q/BCP